MEYRITAALVTVFVLSSCPAAGANTGATSAKTTTRTTTTAKPHPGKAANRHAQAPASGASGAAGNAASSGRKRAPRPTVNIGVNGPVDGVTTSTRDNAAQLSTEPASRGERLTARCADGSQIYSTEPSVSCSGRGGNAADRRR
jgi:hypothetical protein